VDLESLVPYIDWTPFFSSWQLKGKYPVIFDDPVVGEEARKLYNEAQSLLRQIIDEDWIEARAVVGIFPANSVDDDDIEIYDNGSRSKVKERLCNLRQQNKKAKGLSNYCLTDFIAPKSTGKHDYIGGFAVTTGVGIEKWVKKLEDAHDDFTAIQLKAIADRLAEALAEKMHEYVREKAWAYQNNESLSIEELIKEKYHGIRPAPGYPACPDHSEKLKLFDLLKVEENIGITLTENYAMYPAASVSGWYFSHPESKYFGLGKINNDQLEDLISRKNLNPDKLKSILTTIINDNG